MSTPKLIEALLDQLAEHFDADEPLSPDYLIEIDDYHITARALLQRIRLHESLEVL